MAGCGRLGIDSLVYTPTLTAERIPYRPTAKKGHTMRNKHQTILLAVLVLGLAACASTKAQCPNLSGLPLTACEAAALQAQIEAAQPQAFAVLDAAKAVATPDLAARITRAEALWPSIDADLKAVVAMLNAGAAGDYSTAIANAVAWYVDTSALLVQAGGKALPGLPKTVTVNTVK